MGNVCGGYPKLAYLCSMKKVYIILACLFISFQVWGQDEAISQKSITRIHRYFVKHSFCSSEFVKIAKYSVFSIVFKQHQNISTKDYFLAMKKASIASLPSNMIQMLDAAFQVPIPKTADREVSMPMPNAYGSVWVRMPIISTEENSNTLKILKEYTKQGFITPKELQEIKNKLSNSSILHVSMLFDVIIDRLGKDK